MVMFARYVFFLSCEINPQHSTIFSACVIVHLSSCPACHLPRNCGGTSVGETQHLLRAKRSWDEGWGYAIENGTFIVDLAIKIGDFP